METMKPQFNFMPDDIPDKLFKSRRYVFRKLENNLRQNGDLRKIK